MIEFQKSIIDKVGKVRPMLHTYTVIISAEQYGIKVD